MNIDLNWNKEFAKTREGEVRMTNGNHKLYECPAGKKTIGYGYNIEDLGISDSFADQLLRYTLNEAQLNCTKNVKGWDNLNGARKSVLIDMCFNMGWPTLSRFKKFLQALVDKDWLKAAEEMEDSKWFRQVGKRAEVLQEIMIDGKYP